MQPGPKIELAQERLGEDIEAWVTRHRRDDRSWQWIADRLAAETEVSLTRQYLRVLYAERVEAAPA